MLWSASGARCLQRGTRGRSSRGLHARRSFAESAFGALPAASRALATSPGATAPSSWSCCASITRPTPPPATMSSEGHRSVQGGRKPLCSVGRLEDGPGGPGTGRVRSRRCGRRTLDSFSFRRAQAGQPTSSSLRILRPVLRRCSRRFVGSSFFRTRPIKQICSRLEKLLGTI